VAAVNQRFLSGFSAKIASAAVAKSIVMITAKTGVHEPVH